jgi:hypothetical protein
MLLCAAGYRTVNEAGTDPTLGTCSAGMTVLGRGTCYQIDAVADFRIGQPFTNPQRLLVEAKSYSDERLIGLPIVRGAVGVLKDVSEFFVAQTSGGPPTKRYHYHAAIFSSSDFTSDAQAYAFAHDIHLLPLARSSYFAPVIAAIDAAAAALPTTREGQATNVVLSKVRRELRRRLQPKFREVDGEPFSYPWLGDVEEATRSVGRSLIATFGHAFPVFLTPRRDLDLESLSPMENIEIGFRNPQTGGGWSITRQGGESLFTFDLPQQLFRLYADERGLSRRQAVMLKEELLGEFTAIYAPQNEIKIFNFRLAPDWIGRMRTSLD